MLEAYSDSELQVIFTNFLKIVFEELHLYQSRTFPKEKIKLGGKTDRKFFTSHFIRERWICKDTLNPQSLELFTLLNNYFLFEVPRIQQHCPNCKGERTFAIEYCNDYPEEIIPSQIKQHFVFVYKCQHCEVFRLTFLIKRSNLKLTLCGKTEFDQVKINQIIPEKFSDFFKRAIISYHTGYTLAAISYLRLFIEKYVRHELRITDNEDYKKITVLCEDYSKALPVELTSKLPSLKQIYEILSSAYHKGEMNLRENEELFCESYEQLEQHFHLLKAIGR